MMATKLSLVNIWDVCCKVMVDKLVLKALNSLLGMIPIECPHCCNLVPNSVNMSQTNMALGLNYW